MIHIPWNDLPGFDWKSILSVALGAIVTWFGKLLGGNKTIEK